MRNTSFILMIERSVVMRHYTLLKNLFAFLLIFILVLCPVYSMSPKEAEKIVYLTFDDGPTPKVTEALLDTLKENNVKATFFVVGKEVQGREAVLKRIYEEGHTIGLHTYSHNLKTIYASPEAFINELKQTEALLQQVLNTKDGFKIIRFPGGSAGRLNQKFYEALCNEGYLIFDWNIDLKDGVQPNLSPSGLLSNSKKCMDKRPSKIILGHCNSNNQNTCKAIPDIITYYKNEGYVFKAITPDTTPYFYKFHK